MAKCIRCGNYSTDPICENCKMDNWSNYQDSLFTIKNKVYFVNYAEVYYVYDYVDHTFYLSNGKLLRIRVPTDHESIREAVERMQQLYFYLTTTGITEEDLEYSISKLRYLLGEENAKTE